MEGCCCASETDTPEKSEGFIDKDFYGWFQFGLLTLAAGLVMTVTLAVNIEPPVGVSRTILHSIIGSITLICLIIFSKKIVLRAFRKSGMLELLFLIGLGGTISASIYSSVTGTGHIYYEVVLVLLAIYRFGQLISERQIDRLKDINSYIPGLRGSAQIIRNGERNLTSISEVKVGDIIEVKPGQVIPIDGMIVNGQAYLEEQPHTGEPFPVPKHIDDAVQAGTRVLDGEIEILAKVDGDQRQIDLLAQTLSTPLVSRTGGLAQKILRWFVPLVLLSSVLTFAYWFYFQASLDSAIFNSLAIAVVACPCGLGLAIPMATRRADIKLRMMGITPLSSDLLDRLSRIDTVIFDKTGTLSETHLGLLDFQKNDNAPDWLESCLAAIQRKSAHPVARPFWDLADPAEVDSLSIIPLPARGIRAQFNLAGQDHELVIGNYLLRENRRKTTQQTRELYVWLDGDEVAKATLSESARQSSADTIQTLKRLGIHTGIMTGDVSVPEDLCKDVGEIYTGLSAEQKGKLIRSAQNNGQHTLFVGDGLNDLSALHSAEVAIGLSSGSTALNGVAHASLEHDDLSVIPAALALARQTHQKLHRLLTFVIGYNLIGIALAASGQIHPVVASLLMLGSSATVLRATV